MTAAPNLTVPKTPFPAIDAAVTRVRGACAEWVKLSLQEKINLLAACRVATHRLAEEWVRAACAAKGHDFDSPNAGEEWLAGPMTTLRIMRLTEKALAETAKYGVPVIKPEQLFDLPDGRLGVKVFPTDGFDSTLLAKHVGEVHLQKGITRANLKDHQAVHLKKPHAGRVCLVLGAGNVNAIPPTDVLYKLWVEGTACVLKMNPVNEYIGPIMERAFAPLVARGFLQVVYGGAEEGAYLSQHAEVDEIHITGSDKTHDAMVWGTGPDAAQRRAKNEPLLKKEISSELGNITPMIVVPGPWSEPELDFQARSLAGMVCNNASFNCISAKLLVLKKGWDKREWFLSRVMHHLATGGIRKAYYPGAEQRWHQFVDGRKGVRVVGEHRPGYLPYAILTDVDPNDRTDRVWTQEPWCTVLSVTELDAPDTAQWLEATTAFVNDKVWGTLCAMMMLHPRSDGATLNAAETAIRNLRYGAVAVNAWAGAVFGLGQLPWGGHPTSSLQDIQSGRGWVHNTFLLDGVEKSVLRGPAKPFPMPPWVPGHSALHTLGRRLTDFEMSPTLLKIPGIAAAGIRG